MSLYLRFYEVTILEVYKLSVKETKYQISGLTLKLVGRYATKPEKVLQRQLVPLGYRPPVT